MDIFLEKIVTRKKTAIDSLIIVGVIIGVIVAFFVISMIPQVAQFSMFILVGLGYGAFRLITSRNIEYEYAVTNGDIDIDKIVSQRKRKRIFSARCKDFDIVAPVKSSHYTQNISSFKNKIECVSSMNDEGIYFFTLKYKGEQTVVYFQPTEKMLNNFTHFDQAKVFLLNIGRQHDWQKEERKEAAKSFINTVRRRFL